MSVVEKYKGYKLEYYPKCKEYPKHNNKYQVEKQRPYDDSEYFWAYSYDKENWIIVYNGKTTRKFIGTFEQIVDLLEEQNQFIESKLLHN